MLGRNGVFVAHPGSIIWFDGIERIEEQCNVKENSVIFWKNGSYLMKKSITVRMYTPLYFRYIRPVEIDIVDFEDVSILHRGTMLRLKNKDRKIIVRVLNVKKIVLINRSIKRRKNVYFLGVGGKKEVFRIDCELVFPDDIVCVNVKNGGIWRINKNEKFECIFHGEFGLPFTNKMYQLELKDYTQFISSSRKIRLRRKNGEVFLPGVYMTTCTRQIISIPEMKNKIRREITELPGEVLFRSFGSSSVVECIEGLWDDQIGLCRSESYKNFLNDDEFIRHIFEIPKDRFESVDEGSGFECCEVGELLCIIDRGLQYIKKKYSGVWEWKDYVIERKCGFLAGIYGVGGKTLMMSWEIEGMKKFLFCVCEIIKEKKDVVHNTFRSKMGYRVMESLEKQINNFLKKDVVGKVCSTVEPPSLSVPIALPQKEDLYQSEFSLGDISLKESKKKISLLGFCSFCKRIMKVNERNEWLIFIIVGFIVFATTVGIVYCVVIRRKKKYDNIENV